MDEQLHGPEQGRDLERIPLPADMELGYIESRYRARRNPAALASAAGAER